MNAQPFSGLMVSENGFGFRSDTGEIFQMNPPGAAVLEGLRAGEDTDTIARRLADRHGISIQRSRGDVTAFVHQLAALNLLDNYEI